MHDIWLNVKGFSQGLFYGFFSIGANYEKELQREKEKWRCVVFGWSGGPPPENFDIFGLPTLDFLRFPHDFRSFSDIKGLLLGGGGQNPSLGGGGGGQHRGWGDRGGGGGLWPLQYFFKRGPGFSRSNTRVFTLLQHSALSSEVPQIVIFIRPTP